MEETGVESPSFEEVKNCAMGTEGNRLFAKLGKETASLNPPHEYVPWILFNDVRMNHYITISHHTMHLKARFYRNTIMSWKTKLWKTSRKLYASTS